MKWICLIILLLTTTHVCYANITIALNQLPAKTVSSPQTIAKQTAALEQVILAEGDEVNQEILHKLTQSQTSSATSTPSLTKHKKSPLFSVVIEQGSLHDNIIRIVQDAGWNEVVWQVPNDYKWYGSEAMTAINVKDLLQKLLNHYPLQAIFYEANHVVVIVPRDLKS